MNESKKQRNYDTVVYLTACALNGVVPDRACIADIDMNGVGHCAKRHKLSALVAHSLEMAGLAPTEALEAKNRAIRRILLLDAEREQILSELEKRKIKYMPLKGVYIKDYYPALGLREMSDNDILIEAWAREELKEIMLSRGYTIGSFGRGYPDEYTKPPVYNFEIHTSLFMESVDPVAYGHYLGALERAVKTEGTEYCYRMTDEDFYAYVKAHEYKHFSRGGTGLRSLADTYVLEKRFGSVIDGEYVSSELRALGILEYSNMTRSLAKKIFSSEATSRPVGSFYETLEDKEREAYLYICDSGVYGNHKNLVENSIRSVSEDDKITKRSKLKYIKKVIFPSMQTCKDIYPFFYRHKILMPILWIRKICKVIFVKPKVSLKRLRYVMRSDKTGK